MFSLLLLKKLECSLLGDIARLLQLLERLQPRSMLSLGYDAALSGLHQVLLGQPTGSVLGRAVPHLGLRARCHSLAAAHVVLTRRIRIRGIGRIHGVHFYTSS